MWVMNVDEYDRQKEIVECTDGFCRVHLDAHCAKVCGRIVKQLGKSRFDLNRSLPESWAAAVVHFMGKQNGMFGSRHPKHFKAGSIASHFDVSTPTCLKKSRQILEEFSRMGVNDVSLWGVGDGTESGGGKAVAAPKKSRKKKAVAGERALQFKIVLRGVRPPIWRRVVVPGRMTLGEFHLVIQESMGWYNCHLHQFEVNGRVYSDPSFELDNGFYSVENEDRVRLEQILSAPGTKMLYEYDFGDSWHHVVTLEKEVSADRDMLPVCLKGKRACPPEDCGGPWGYGELLDILNDPEHEEHEDMLEWVGGHFDSEEFDLDSVNRDLENLARNFKN